MVGAREERRRIPAWHRGVFALAAAPLLLFTLMGWEHGAYVTFGIPALIVLWLVVRPTRLAATILFWPFTAGAVLYGCLLVMDLMVLSQGGSPSVLLDTDDSVVFVLLELTLIVVAVLLFVIWQPYAARSFAEAFSKDFNAQSGNNPTAEM